MRTTLVALLCLCAGASKADTLRCGTRLIQQGDTISKVRDLCGEPSDVQASSILRRPTYRLNGHYYYLGDELAEVPVYLWTYNFGPYKFMRRVRFVDGLVEEIETLGYGYNR